MISEVKYRNVLFVSHVSSKKFGGGEQVLDNLICGFDPKRFKTVLLVQKPLIEHDDLDWDCKSITTIENFNFGSLSYRSKLIALLTMVPRIIKACFYIGYLIKKHDIDIICANAITASVYSVIPARLFRKRFFYYEHNIAEQRKGLLIGLALRPVTYMATDIICISKAVKNSLIKENVPESKLHLVYNGYDFKSLDDVGVTDIRLPSRYQKNILRIGMVANFIPWKRHRLFLELMDKLSNALPEIRIEATIVGGCLPGNEDYYQEIVDWVKNYNGAARYILAGFQKNIADYIRSFDVLINPAKAEPFGLVFIEAMYLGCVVVGSVEGAAPEILDDGVTGCIVDYDQGDDVLKRLIEMASNLQGRINMGKNASLMAQKRFSINNQISQIEDLFEKVS